MPTTNYALRTMASKMPMQISGNQMSTQHNLAEQQPISERPLAWPDALLALLVGGLSLALYIRTLVPFVLVGDSAEFQVLAYQVGIAHTPGYPVYLLLAKLSTFLPI